MANIENIAFSMTYKQLAGALITIVAATWGALWYFVSPLHDQIAEVRGEISDLKDPEDGYASLVRRGVEDAVGAALTQDNALRLEVDAKINEQIAAALQANTEQLALLRTEVVNALNAQTDTLRESIKSLDAGLNDVRVRQNLLLQRIFGTVPENPEDLIKRSGTTGTLPLLVIDDATYRTLTGTGWTNEPNRTLFLKASEFDPSKLPQQQ